LAVERGIPALVNEALLRITLEMAANHEKPGKYTPAELLGIFKTGLNADFILKAVS